METETKRLRTLPTPAAENAAMVVALVLGNIDILREILFLLDAPFHLVRAALVSKDWLRAAADPSFLRRFHARSPPRLLGFLASFASPPTNPPVEGAAFTRFVPLPHLPELDVAARLVGAAFNAGAGGQTKGVVVSCRNGRVLFKHGGYYGKRYSVRTPLRPSAVGPTTVARPSAVPPQRVRDIMEPDVRCAQLELLPYPGVDDRRDALSGFGDLTNSSRDRYDERIMQQAVYVRQHRGWIAHVSRPMHFPVPVEDNHEPYSVLVGGRWLCMTTVLDWIVVFDLNTGDFSAVMFPNGVSVAQHGHDHMLARAGDTGVYLVHVKGVELHVWFREMGNDAAVWERLETVDLPRVFRGHIYRGFWNYVYALASNMMNCWDYLEYWDRASYRVRIHAVGDDAEFVFLTLGCHGGVFLLDVKRKTVQKVLQTSLENDGGPLCGISAFMMPWPPVFPALKQT